MRLENGVRLNFVTHKLLWWTLYLFITTIYDSTT